jgi:putative transposase
VNWLQETFAVSRQRACRLLTYCRASYYYKPVTKDERALILRLRELAFSRVRYGYRRLTILLQREGWPVGKKRILRLYRTENLLVRTKHRKKRTSHLRVPLGPPTAPNQRWSIDFMSARLESGRYFRILTIIDQFSRECPLLWADMSLTGAKVVACLELLAGTRGLPMAITLDNGSEFCSRAMDVWAYKNGVKLDFIRPGRPVENGYIESFNGRLRDECLNIHVFFDLADVREKLEAWRRDYNEVRPHGSLGKMTPKEFARRASPLGGSGSIGQQPLATLHQTRHLQPSTPPRKLTLAGV